MYIVLFDKFLINGEERSYYICKNEQYDLICRQYPGINELLKEDIDEMLIFAGKAEADKKALTVECESIEIIENGIKIGYGKAEDLDCTCDEIRRRLYGYSKRNGLNNDNISQYIYVIQNTKDYAYIKGEKVESKYKNMMSVIEEYKRDKNWKGIVDLYPKQSEIEKSEYWNDYYCLSQLSFALTMLASASDKKTERNLKREYEKFYLKVSDRCLELEPESVMELSTRAYFYYNQFINGKRDESYYKAYEIYEKLLGMSSEWYKELYRFTKLRQMNFEKKHWTGEFGEEWFEKTQEILNDYKKLIEAYSTLDDRRKSKYKKEYLKVLFGYSGFSIDILFDYWDIYFDNRFYGRRIKDYKLQTKQFESINLVDEYLSILYEEKDLQNPTAAHLLEKPSYFEIKYRLAQIKQIKGIVYILKGRSIEEYEKYFLESNKQLDELFKTVRDFKEKVRFNFPDYAKVPQAINDYFLGEFERCHGRFYKAKTYMKYEEARIYILEGKKEEARNILLLIPQDDKCYNKTQRLLGDLNDEK